MHEWRMHTPDGRSLVATREKDAWIVRCGAAEAQSPVLDVALIEAIRADAEVVTHSSKVDYGPGHAPRPIASKTSSSNANKRS